MCANVPVFIKVLAGGDKVRAQYPMSVRIFDGSDLAGRPPFVC